MQLTFETVAIIGDGNFPDFVQFEKTEGEIFFLNGGKMYGTTSERINGDFENPIWQGTYDIGQVGETGITNLELKTISGFGIVGSYATPTTHKLLIYEFQQDMSKYLESGSIKHSIDSAISSFTLSLENPIDDETEIQGQVVINEKSSLLSPGAKIRFGFGIGDDYEEFEMGTFYVDRSTYSVSSETADVDGRNLIGKALLDQTLNENSNIRYKTVTTIFNDIFEGANLMADQYEVQTDSTFRRFEFDPKKTTYSAIEEILRSMINWRIEETADGEIIVGAPNYGLFPQRSTYSFMRNKDIFSRSITMDDQESYRKVCAHNENFSISVYKDVKVYTGWNLQSNKTLFVQIAEGTSLPNATAIAVDVANRLESAGKIESFTGLIRPQLLVGDGATIIDDDGSTQLGLITEVTHSFGKSGFTTDFTVDSGGRLGRGLLSDYIKMMDNKREVGSVFYEDLPIE